MIINEDIEDLRRIIETNILDLLTPDIVIVSEEITSIDRKIKGLSKEA